ncbi:cold-shock protein [Aureibaculum conchae]|uniref:cold-shock protein n=1 Tax=Aureibaculum sp. 2308TA14-22 TaxID=3108392 RepID=UPI003394E3B1
MARAQETFGKKEREKKRLKKREEKKKRKEARKAGEKNDTFIYVDEFGQLTDTPPDPSKKIKVDAEDIVVGVPKKEEQEEEDPIRNGKVNFYDDKKGFGFIVDTENNEKYFVHVSGLLDDIQENDKVIFELEKGQKGLNAVRVKKQ